MENKENTSQEGPKNKFQVEMKRFYNYLDDLILHKEKFKISYNGSTIIIDWKDVQWTFVDRNHVVGKGFHLCRYVNADVQEYVKNVSIPGLNDIPDVDTYTGHDQPVKHSDLRDVAGDRPEISRDSDRDDDETSGVKGKKHRVLTGDGGKDRGSIWKSLADQDHVKPILEIKPNMDLEVQKGNMEGLLKYQGQTIYGVDVNDCYWDTAYKMGFIKQETWLKGLKKKEWKIGRNASIGALNKVTMVIEYTDGVKGKAYAVKSDRKIGVVRNNIIHHVHTMFLELLKQLDNEWLMYFTDCIYVPIDKVKIVQDYFQAKGYQTKVDTYQLDKFEKETGKTEWFDFKKNVPKTFQFSQRQFSLERMSYIEQDLLQAGIKENTDFLNQI